MAKIDEVYKACVADIGPQIVASHRAISTLDDLVEVPDRMWDRVNEYQFNELALWLERNLVELTDDECNELMELLLDSEDEA